MQTPTFARIILFASFAFGLLAFGWGTSYKPWIYTAPIFATVLALYARGLDVRLRTTWFVGMWIMAVMAGSFYLGNIRVQANRVACETRMCVNWLEADKFWLLALLALGIVGYGLLFVFSIWALGRLSRRPSIRGGSG